MFLFSGEMKYLFKLTQTHKISKFERVFGRRISQVMWDLFILLIASVLAPFLGALQKVLCLFLPEFPVLSPEGYKNSHVHKKVLKAIDIVDICAAHGYKVHEHVVRTTDGYLLTIHRLIGPTTDLSIRKPVVYFHHGLLTNSELFVLGASKSSCFPFVLVDKGYDVWLGNNRGNKYSRKHLNLSSEDLKFWDYSLDEFALYDIPDTIDYILGITEELQLNYVGFSQGSAQAFGALALNPDLNQKIKLFVGLSPAMIPKGLSHPVAKWFVDSASSLIFRIFGKRAILPSVVFWQKIMGDWYYRLVVDKSLILLFDWKSANITFEQKTIGYPHMFSPSSVKSVVHWFQIIKNKRFQMFDDDTVGSLAKLTSTHSKVHRVAPFPVQLITTPTFLIYGENDMLIDMESTRASLTSVADLTVLGIKDYEHMDVLWAQDVEQAVFRPALEKIEKLNAPKLRNRLTNGHTVHNNTKPLVDQLDESS